MTTVIETAILVTLQPPVFGGRLNLAVGDN